MQHGITEQEWIDYLDDSAASAVRDRIETHLIGCVSCWELHEQLAHTSQALYNAGAEARRYLTLEDQRLHAMLRNIFLNLSGDRSEPVSRQQVQRQIHALKSLFVPFCGTQAATRALQTAARHSSACSLERVRPENWEPFMERLTAIAVAMCGDTFASLVQEKGRL